MKKVLSRMAIYLIDVALCWWVLTSALESIAKEAWGWAGFSLTVFVATATMLVQTVIKNNDPETYR